MAFFEQVFGSHSVNLRNALGKTSQRHSLISNNLANVNTPGFKRQDSEFGIQLEKAANRHRGTLPRFESEDPREQMQALRSHRQNKFDSGRDERSLRLDGSSVDLESEVTAMAETELRYQALSDLTASYFSGLKSVIREGK